MKNITYRNPGVVITMALFSVVINTKEANKLRVEDITSLLVRLDEEGVDFGDIGIRRVPGAYYSDEVEQFLGQFLLSGYVSKNSFRLTKEGHRVCKKIIKEEIQENPESITRIAEALDIEISSL